jgi:hypothetical protein
MLGCVTEVFVAQAFPQKSAAVIVEKGAISELSMHDTGQTLLDAPRQRMIRPERAGCKEIAHWRCSKSSEGEAMVKRNLRPVDRL